MGTNHDHSSRVSSVSEKEPTDGFSKASSEREVHARATSKEVALRAGVSQSTVSRVFNPNWKGSVKKEARERVLRAAEELQYAPNTIAHILTSKRSGIIGVIISKSFDLFYYEVMGVLASRLNARGYQTMVFTTDPKRKVSDLLTDMVRYQVDGVIITSSAVTHDLEKTNLDVGIPVVLFNGFVPGLQLSAVCSDNYDACGKMADYLVKAGHKRFAYISTFHSKYHNYMPRQEAFLYGLSRNGIHQCQIEDAGYSYESGAAVAKKLIKPHDYPDAVFCAGDLNALGFIDVAKERGLRVGEDISIAGFDAPDSVGLPAYDLTVLHQDINQLSEDAINVLLQLIDDPSMSPVLVTRPMELIIRGSSRKLPTGVENETP